MTPSTGDAVNSTASTANAPAPSPPPAELSLVEAPRMTSTKFPTWEAFSAYFHDYQRQTFQVYICKTSTSVATRNQKIVANNGKYSQDPYAIFDSSVIPTEIGYYAKTMICTHGGKARSRGRGLRPNQQFCQMQCPARISVLAQKKSGGHNVSSPSGWQVVVTQQNPTHNHPLDLETFKKYPRNRQVQDPMVLEAVNALRKAGVKRRDIHKYITEMEPTRHVTRSDVNNLLTKLKSDDSFVTRIGDAQQQVATTRVDRRNEVVSTATTTNEVEQLSSDASGDQEVGTDGTDVTLQRADISPGFTLRRSNGGKREIAISAQCAGQGGKPVHSLQRLCDDSEVTSSSFKLRVSRLEEQNLALYRQNTKNHEQNQVYVTELDEARQKTREAEAKVLMLQKSEATLAEGVSALSQEVTRLKAENEKLRAPQESTRITPSESGSQASLMVAGSNREKRSSDSTTQHVSKRRLSTSTADGASETVRPSKRAATHSTTKAGASTEADSSTD